MTLRAYRLSLPAELYVTVHAESPEDAIEQGDILRRAMRNWDSVADIGDLTGGEIPEGLRTGEIDGAAFVNYYGAGTSACDMPTVIRSVEDLETACADATGVPE